MRDVNTLLVTDDVDAAGDFPIGQRVNFFSVSEF